MAGACSAGLTGAPRGVGESFACFPFHPPPAPPWLGYVFKLLSTVAKGIARYSLIPDTGSRRTMDAI
jgi:hypothetical protein